MITPEQKRQALEAIAAKHDGILRPEDVVMEAASPDHPLHDQFEWSDQNAAHSYRVDQARTLIRSVKVETKTTTRTLSTVYYVRDPNATADQGGYVNLPRLKTDAELGAAALVQEFSRAAAALVRARDLACALGLDVSIDDVIERVEKMADAVPMQKAA
jgi:hypothetical protein